MNFVFTLLDTGCFLTILQKSTIIGQAFFQSIPDFEKSKEYEIFSKTSQGVIHIFLDIHEQHYERYMFPKLGRRKIHSMVRQRCYTENSSSRFIQARQESKNGYLFVDMMLGESLQAWISFLGKSDHLLKNPRLLSLELEKIFYSSLIPEPPSTSCTIVTYHEPELGLRQIIFLERQICATRLVTLSSGDPTEEIVMETQTLVNYLVETHAVHQNNVGFIFLGHKKIWGPLKHFPHVVVEWSAHHPATAEIPSFISTWSGLAFFLCSEKPLLSLRLPSLYSYERHEKQRKTFYAGSILCLAILGIGGMMLMHHLDVLEKKYETLVHKISLQQKTLQSYPSVKVLNQWSVLEPLITHYRELTNQYHDPFVCFKDLNGWIQEGFKVNHVEWTYYMAPFQRSPSHLVSTEALKRSHRETLDVWLSYQKKDVPPEKALRAQLSIPLHGYTIVHEVPQEGKSASVKEKPIEESELGIIHIQKQEREAT